MKVKKILITGGNGFIAKSLKEQLSSAENYQGKFLRWPYNIVSYNSSQLDLTDSKKVEKFITNRGYDIVIHGATYDAAPEFSDKNPNLVLEKNLRMFFNIARCSDHFGKMIYFGSGAEFNRENWTSKMKESYYNENVPIDQYGYSKYLMNKHSLESSNIYNLRLFGVFGEYDDWRYRFIPNACCKAVLGKPIKMRFNSVFDYLYIDDLAKVVKWFINNTPKYKNYNICTGECYSYKDLAEKIKRVSGKDLDIVVENDTGGYEYSGDNTRFCEESGIKFQNIDDSIKKIYNWYNQNNSIIDEKLFVY